MTQKFPNASDADVKFATLAEDDIFNFEDFMEALSALPWGQEDGSPTNVDRTGKEYTVLSESAPSRHCDVDQVTRVVLQKAYRRLISHIDDKRIDRGYRKSGSIHWRTRPEFNCFPFSIVTQYRNDGPDTCELTDRRCFKDNDWVLVKLYARFSFVAGNQ